MDIRLKASLALERRVLEASERTLGPEHPSTLIALENLARTLEKAGQEAEAEELQRRLWQASTRSCGGGAPEASAPSAKRAPRPDPGPSAISAPRARGSDAELLERRVLQASERTLGPSHPSTLIAVGNLATTLSKLGREDEAAVLRQRVTDGTRLPESARSSRHVAGISGDSRHVAKTQGTTLPSSPSGGKPLAGSGKIGATDSAGPNVALASSDITRSHAVAKGFVTGRAASESPLDRSGNLAGSRLALAGLGYSGEERQMADVEAASGIGAATVPGLILHSSSKQSLGQPASEGHSVPQRRLKEFARGPGSEAGSQRGGRRAEHNCQTLSEMERSFGQTASERSHSQRPIERIQEQREAQLGPLATDPNLIDSRLALAGLGCGLDNASEKGSAAAASEWSLAQTSELPRSMRVGPPNLGGQQRMPGPASERSTGLGPSERSFGPAVTERLIAPKTLTVSGNLEGSRLALAGLRGDQTAMAACERDPGRAPSEVSTRPIGSEHSCSRPFVSASQKTFSDLGRSVEVGGVSGSVLAHSERGPMVSVQTSYVPSERSRACSEQPAGRNTPSGPGNIMAQQAFQFIECGAESVFGGSAAVAPLPHSTSTVQSETPSKRSDIRAFSERPVDRCKSDIGNIMAPQQFQQSATTSMARLQGHVPSLRARAVIERASGRASSERPIARAMLARPGNFNNPPPVDLLASSDRSVASGRSNASEHVSRASSEQPPRSNVSVPLEVVSRHPAARWPSGQASSRTPSEDSVRRTPRPGEASPTTPPPRSGGSHRAASYQGSGSQRAASAQRQGGPSEPQARQMLEVSERTLGPNHPNTLIALGNLGTALSNRRREAEAEPLRQRLLQALERTSGPSHPNTLAAAANLAATLGSLGRDEEAKALLQRVADSSERALGPDHPSTLIAVGNYAATLTKLDYDTEAEPLKRRVLEASERVLGREHPNTFNALGHLATTLGNLGRDAEAEPLLARALDISERVFGQDHPNTLIALGNIALTFTKLGRHSEAEPLLAHALEVSERTLGPDHPNTLVSLGNLAATLGHLGREADAEPLKRRAFESSERTLGMDHPNTLVALGHLAATLSNLGRDAEAEPLLAQALATSERILGRNHPSTLVALGNFGATLGKLGRDEEAEPLQRRVLEISEKTLGKDHPNTLAALGHLGVTLSTRGFDSEAEPLLARALEGCERVLGGDHPSTLVARGNLASALDKIGRDTDTEALRRSVRESWRP